MITRDPNNPLSFLLLDSGFAESEYWPNNFNDMLSAMNVSAFYWAVSIQILIVVTARVEGSLQSAGCQQLVRL
jgi:hypothetical protein